jgi:hypothetical protein
MPNGVKHTQKDHDKTIKKMDKKKKAENDGKMKSDSFVTWGDLISFMKGE